MLKQLLKYEFKATKSLYFGLYLALALLSVVLGVSFRRKMHGPTIRISGGSKSF